jgi:hypothetical protein
MLRFFFMKKHFYKITKKCTLFLATLKKKICIIIYIYCYIVTANKKILINQRISYVTLFVTVFYSLWSFCYTNDV